MLLFEIVFVFILWIILLSLSYFVYIILTYYKKILQQMQMGGVGGKEDLERSPYEPTVRIPTEYIINLIF